MPIAVFLFAVPVRTNNGHRGPLLPVKARLDRLVPINSLHSYINTKGTKYKGKNYQSVLATILNLESSSK
jgi:hypothetical protein